MLTKLKIVILVFLDLLTCKKVTIHIKIFLFVQSRYRQPSENTNCDLLYQPKDMKVEKRGSFLMRTLYIRIRDGMRFLL